MTRQIDPQGKALIQSFESCKLTSYQDDGGVWTIGWGHTGPEVKAGQTITQQQADDLFEHDITTACQDIVDLVKVGLTDNEFAALVSFDYNVGRPKFSTSTLLRLLNGGDFASVPSQLLRWDKIEINDVFVDSPGLLRRRRAEGALWLTPDDVVSFAQIPAQSITPTVPTTTPLYKTKTMMGLMVIVAGKIVELLMQIDYTTAIPQLAAFSSLGPWVPYVTFGMTMLGIITAAYGRTSIRLRKGE